MRIRQHLRLRGRRVKGMAGRKLHIQPVGKNKKDEKERVDIDAQQ
jgi:hypothetical protein